MSQLIDEIAALEELESHHKNEIERIEQSTPMDMGTFAAHEARLKETQEKLAAKRNELAKIEGAATTAQNELYSQFDNITIGDITLTLREMCSNEQYYQVLSGWLQGYVGDMAQRHATIETSYKSQVEALEEQVVELDKYRKQSIELTDKLADMELRRDAAGNELRNAQEEVKRVTADNEALRKQLESTPKTATNINTNLADIAKQLHEAKPAIYNKRWEDDLRRTSYVANLVSGEEITIPRLEIGRYREVTPEEADTFRAEEAARVAKAAEEDLANQALVTPPSLPSTEGHELDQENTSVGVAGETVTREEFQELKREVYEVREKIARMEYKAGNVA